jgi:hypothetical protein
MVAMLITPFGLMMRLVTTTIPAIAILELQQGVIIVELVSPSLMMPPLDMWWRRNTINMCWIEGGAKANKDSTVVSARRIALTMSMRSAPNGATVSYAVVKGITLTCACDPTMAVPQGITMWMMGIATLVTAAPNWASYDMASSTMCMITMA